MRMQNTTQFTTGGILTQLDAFANITKNKKELITSLGCIDATDFIPAGGMKAGKFSLMSINDIYLQINNR